MAISRCRYWCCAKCRNVHRKNNLAETIRRLAGRRPEEELTGKFACSKCGARHAKADVYGGSHDVPKDQWSKLDEPVELAEEEESEDEVAVEAITSDPPPRARRLEFRDRARKEIQDDEFLIEAEVDDEPKERKRRKGGSRRKELGWVNVGLAIHYGGMVAFLLAIAAGWLALLLLVIAVSKISALKADSPPSASLLGTLFASGVLFLISNGLTVGSNLTDLVSSILCLRVPDSTARGFLIGAFCTRLLAVPVGLTLLFFVPYGFAVLSSTLLAIIGWVLWVGFLRNLSECLKQPVLARESIDVTFSAVKLTLAWVFGMGTLIGLVFLMVNMRRVGGCFMGFFIATFIGGTVGTIRYLVLTDRFGSLTNLVLYPTGIPLIMRYLDLIGSLRMVILRRA